MNWIQRTRIVWVVAAFAWPGVLLADEDPSGSAEDPARFASVTEAVSESPETAPEIVGSLSRSFPDSAPVIVTSAIEGLPEVTDEAVRDIVDAAVEAAPEEEAAIEAAVAGLREADEPAEAGDEEAGETVAEPEESEEEATEEVSGEADRETAASADEAVTDAEPEEEPEVRDEADTATEEVAGTGERPAGEEEATARDDEFVEEAVEEVGEEPAMEAERPERLEREVDLVVSLTGTFPDRAPSIARRSVGRVADEGALWTAAIVEAAIGVAPDHEEEIVSEAIAEAPQHEAAIHEAARSVDPEEESDGDGEDTLPARLRSEVEMVESLIRAFPDRTPVTVRRSVERVADKEAFWSGALVGAALAAEPEQEEAIVDEAVAAAPHHEAAIREAAGWEAPEEESLAGEEPVDEEPEVAEAETGEAAAEEIPEEELPDRLQTAVERAESLTRTFPDRAPETVRRSVGRVSAEDASWTLAILEAVLDLEPEQSDAITAAAVEAAPRHEEAILAWVSGEEGDEAAEEGAGEDEAVFEEPFILAGATESVTLDGDRLSVRFEVPATEASRVRLAVESLELRIQPEQYFDSYKGRYRQRDMAIITGDGIVGLVFKLKPDDAEQLRGTSAALARFQDAVASIDAFITAKRADEETGLLLGELREEIGTVYQYPSRDKIAAEFVGDLDDGNYQLAIGGSIRLTPDTAPAVRHLVENLPRYEREYRELLREREEQLKEFQKLTRTQPDETVVEEKDES